MRRLILAAALATLASSAVAQDNEPTSATPPPPGETMPTFPSDPAGRSISTRLTPSVETCSWLLRVNGTLTKVAAPTLDLIRTTAPLTRPTQAGILQGVYCERDSMVPGEQDDRVPRQLGVPLFINGPGGVTTVAIKDQKFAISFSKNSTMTAAQQEAVRGVVARWEARDS